jgi:hypothetical protein
VHPEEVVGVANIVFRIASAVAGLAFTLLTVGFVLGWSWVEQLWPFMLDETRLGQIFLSSIALAIALPAVWVAVTGSVRSAAAGSINLVVMFGAMTAYLLGQSGDRPELRAYAIGTAAAAVILLGAFVHAQRQPWLDQRRMPTPLRVAFVVFALALVLVAVQLIRKSPHIFPWPLADGSSVMYGLIFLGAAVYFVVGILEARWASATGQLIGFLAYDLVLIVPFAQRFGNVPAEHRPSLIVYTGVLVVSGAIAIWYLLLDRATRLGGSGAGLRPQI